MNIIGVSALYHESACCLLQSGRPVAAATEERFSRLKHAARLPVGAFRLVYKQVGWLSPRLTPWAFYEAPDKKHHRQQATGVHAGLLESYTPCDQAFTEPLLRDGLGYDGSIFCFEQLEARYQPGGNSVAVSGAPSSARWCHRLGNGGGAPRPSLQGWKNRGSLGAVR